MAKRILLFIIEEIFVFWKLLLLIFAILFLIIFFNISQKGRYQIVSNGLVLDTKTGAVYIATDKLIKKDNKK